MISQIKLKQTKKYNRIIWQTTKWDNINGSEKYYLLTDLQDNFIAKSTNYNKILELYIAETNKEKY